MENRILVFGRRMAFSYKIRLRGVPLVCSMTKQRGLSESGGGRRGKKEDSTFLI